MEKLLSPKAFSCDLCGKTFSRRSSMVQHKRIHSGEKPHRCEICLKAFTRPYSLQKHQCCHTGEKPFSCNLCGRNFSRSSTLVQHKQTHAGEKPFQCDICHEYFSRRSTLNQHQRTHSGEKPYVCNICSKQFTRRYTLNKHTKDHMCEESYNCNVCGQCFTKPYALQKHQRCHTGEKQYTCEVCRESFSRRSNLHVHQRTHTGEKPFKCTICGKFFSRRSNLRVHEQGHSGIKRYECNLCGKQFVRNSTLTKHKQRHLSDQDVCVSEQRQGKKINLINSSNSSPTKIVPSLCSGYEMNQEKVYLCKPYENNSNLLHCNPLTSHYKNVKGSSNDNNYDNNNINDSFSIDSTHRCNMTDPSKLLRQTLSPFCTHCRNPPSDCSHQQLPSEPLCQTQKINSQLSSYPSTVPSKSRPPTLLTHRKWLEPPTVIVASSEDQNEKFTPASSCLHPSGSDWQRNIPSGLVTAPLCNTLIIMDTPSIMET